MRRLPVYFVVDVSDSMVDEPLKAVQEGLAICMDALSSDPYALETAYINVIAFAGKVEKLVDMQESYLCRIPNLNVGSGTSFGKALEYLMNDIDAKVCKSTEVAKGDWRPIVFFFTDGAPTDDYRSALARWKNSYSTRCSTIAIALGRSADLKIFSEITEDVVRINDVDSSVIKRVFKWISSSVQTKSAAVGVSGDGNFTTSTLAVNGVEKVDAKTDGHDRPSENFVLVHGRCEKTKEDYLIKYEKVDNSEFYQFVGAYKINGNKYAELSVDTFEEFQVDGRFLHGEGACPCCENDLSLVKCGSCGHIQCASSKKKISTCPWCGKPGTLGFAQIKVGRSLG